MFKKTILIVILAIAFVSPVFAGTWADGWSDDPTKASNSAQDNAMKASASRETGCYSGQIRYVEKVKGLYHFQALYHHRNGSCAKKSDDQQFLEEVARDAIKAGGKVVMAGIAL